MKNLSRYYKLISVPRLGLKPQAALAALLLTACGPGPASTAGDADEAGPAGMAEGDLPGDGMDLPTDAGVDEGGGCPGGPTDLQTDPLNCGECGNICRGLKDPGDLSPEVCVDGECQPNWAGCAPLRLEGQPPLSCDEMCQGNGYGGCAQNGCSGETLLIWRGVTNDFFSCVPNSNQVELNTDYSCADPMPLQQGEPPAVDYYSCCCAPPA